MPPRAVTLLFDRPFLAVAGEFTVDGGLPPFLPVNINARAGAPVLFVFCDH